MKGKILLVTLVCLLVSSLFLTGCNGNETTTTSTTQTGGANWWDKFGEPQYGGTITYRMNGLNVVFDPVLLLNAQYSFHLEPLVTKINMTVDREEWAFNTDYTPDKYCQGVLAESWEQPDPQTIIFHLHQGIYWQDKPPLNGREFTADDVQQHYDRIRGTGSGYTEPIPIFGSMVENWESVTAIDKYTIQFKFKEATCTSLLSLMDTHGLNMIEPPELAKQEGALTDWQNAVGTGPWILTDYVADTSLTFSKNPNYHGYDERFPENKLPYTDELTLLNIPDVSTALGALRTGKVDVMTGLTWQQAKTLKESAPDIMQSKVPGGASGVAFRLDKEPFTDIRVRKALEMAIDRDNIAENFYGGTANAEPVGLVNTAYKDFAFAYEDWPQDLKDEYEYNPDKARQLLADAGYPDGFKTEVITSSNGELLQIFKSQFMDIGVDMEISITDWVSYNAITRDSKHEQMYAGSGAVTWPPTRFVEVYYSKGTDKGQHMSNDSDYDALHDQFVAATDWGTAEKVSRELDRYIIEQHWQVLTGETFTVNAWQPYVKGYTGEAHVWIAGSYLWASLWVADK